MRKNITYKCQIDIEKNRETLDRIEQAITGNGCLCGLRFWVHGNTEIGETLIKKLFLIPKNSIIYQHDCKNADKTKQFFEEMYNPISYVPLGYKKIFICDKPELLGYDEIHNMVDFIERIDRKDREVKRKIYPAMLVFTTTEAMSNDSEAAKLYWGTLKEHCIYCPIEIDVL
jgi:hypothetical protein